MEPEKQSLDVDQSREAPASHRREQYRLSVFAMLKLAVAGGVCLMLSFSLQEICTKIYAGDPVYESIRLSYFWPIAILIFSAYCLGGAILLKGLGWMFQVDRFRAYVASLMLHLPLLVLSTYEGLKPQQLPYRPPDLQELLINTCFIGLSILIVGMLYTHIVKDRRNVVGKELLDYPLSKD